MPVIPHTESTDTFETWRLSTNLTIDELSKNNLTATTDPAVGDDSSGGYSANSVWLNTTSGTLFTCLDSSSGAAVWKSPEQAASEVSVAMVIALS